MKIPKDTLILHCKCNSCTHWEVLFNEKTKQYSLFCKTCKEVVPLSEFVLPAHQKLHWEKL